MQKKIKTQQKTNNINKKKIGLMIFLSFLGSLGGSALVYVISSYLEDLTGKNGVGLEYFLAYAILFFVLINFHNLINKFGKINLFLILQFFKIILLFFLSFLPMLDFNVVLILGYLILSYITWVEMDVILENFSTDQLAGRIRGAYLSCSNLGYLIGPIISTRLLDKYGYPSVFIFGMLVSSFFFVLAILNFSKIKTKTHKSRKSKEVIRRVLLNSDLRRIYAVSVILEIFYALMVVYVPIYFLTQGLSWSQIGIIFSLVHIPFIVLQYPVGVLADKKFGEKELMAVAFLIMGSSTFLIYFIQSNSLLFWIVIMLVTRIGAALIEALRDSYFYKKIDGKDVDIIDFFRTAGPLAFALTPVVISGVLLFFEMKTIFILVGLIIFMGIIPVLKLKDNLSEKEIFVSQTGKVDSSLN